MRRVYIVTYDISDPKRWRKVFRTMKGYGQHLQLSVFQCDLTETARVELGGKLQEVIHQGKDQVLLFDLGPTDANPIKRVDALGRPAEFYEREAVIA